MSRKIIRYVTGISRDEETLSTDFDSFKERHNLGEGIIGAHAYTGPLDREDFKILDKVFNSYQVSVLHDKPRELLQRIREACGYGKREYISEGLTYLSRLAKNGIWQEEEHSIEGLQEASPGFIRVLEEILHNNVDLPKLKYDAEKEVIKSAQRNGQYKPISFVYLFNKKITLDKCTKTLIFI